MILNSIELQNFRQYKKTIKIDFARDNDDKNITLIVAANGVGKTTFLQAFRYCFYGKSTNYLNLPGSELLVNNTLVDSIEELDKADMRVQVTFTHDGVKYLAIREQTFTKYNDRIVPFESERFRLSYLSKNDAWKSLDPVQSTDKIQSILPDGLSQIFMFDGERMERNLGDPTFGIELKESILGILDIKKYDKLIEVIGSAGNSSTVLGMLKKKLSSPSKDQQDKLNKNQHYLELKEKTELEIRGLMEKVEIINDKISIVKADQTKIEEAKELAYQRDKADDQIDKLDDTIHQLSEKYLTHVRNALVYKLMLKNKVSYDNFIKQGNKSELFYNSLHINTIEDVLSKGECICGRKITDHSDEEIRLHKLKEHALPVESAQYLNLIDQLYKRSAEFQDVNAILEKIKDEIRIAGSAKEDSKYVSNKLNQEIKQINQKYGSRLHQDYDDLNNKKMEIMKKIGSVEKTLNTLNNAINKSEKIISKIENGDEKNRKIMKVIEIITDIKAELMDFRDKKDRLARETLQSEFDIILNDTLQGNYSVKIDPNYKINILDNDTNRDVTTVLSTGQNVVISLTFINALIATAKKLSTTIDSNEKYGVIMDAALSNLDEKHIDRICKNNLKELDQLIFLSFKRQLRDEMYQGIKSNIGKAYMLRKNKSGYVEMENIEMDKLDQFIHKYEE